MSINFKTLFCGASLVVLFCMPVLAGDSDIVDAFRQHVDSLSVKALQKKSAQDRIEAFAVDSPSDAITEGLIALYPEYATAIDSSEDDDLDAASDLLTPLTKSDDKFLAADSSFFLARMLMNSEQFEDAIPLLKSLQEDFSDETVHAQTSDYFLGVAYAGMLENQQASDAFRNFYQSNPDAPERMRVSAYRQLQRLQEIQQGALGDIHQRMEYSRRRLELKQTDDPTQDQQEKIVTMLSKLIKEAEKQEASSSSKNTKKQQEKEAEKKPQPGGEKGEESKGSQQGGEKGDEAKASDGSGAVVQTFENLPASPWEKLRERSRDPANTAIKEKLPAQYRDIVEKYMKKATGESK